jgi:hypothetical protein
MDFILTDPPYITHYKDRSGLGCPGVLIADIHGEELNEAPSGTLPCSVDKRRKFQPANMHTDFSIHA